MTCAGCGSAVGPSDNFCELCGLGQPTGRDHVEIDLGVAAAVSDRGLVHHRNEDAVALRANDNTVLVVVSDGVSTSDLADEASLAAVDAAIDVLTAGGPTEKAVPPHRPRSPSCRSATTTPHRPAPTSPPW